jgi:hypothetical protein
VLQWTRALDRQLLERVTLEPVRVIRPEKHHDRFGGPGGAIQIVFDAGGQLEFIVQTSPATGREHKESDRRKRVRYDRLGVIIDAWMTLVASVISFRLLHEDAVAAG